MKIGSRCSGELCVGFQKQIHPLVAGEAAKEEKRAAIGFCFSAERKKFRGNAVGNCHYTIGIDGKESPHLRCCPLTGWTDPIGFQERLPQPEVFPVLQRKSGTTGRRE